jgi:hypothetical protein
MAACAGLILGGAGAVTGGGEVIGGGAVLSGAAWCRPTSAMRAIGFHHARHDRMFLCRATPVVWVFSDRFR